jgi:hypothetical protein
MGESPTGNGYVQGSSSYREDDARREIREMARSRKAGGENQKFTGVDDLRADPNDPNFGDYNIPSGGNHP